MARTMRTVVYECLGGPRDGDRVRILRRKRTVMLGGALYRVRRVSDQECLVWEYYPNGALR